MEIDVALNEIIKELSWREKILVKIFAKTFYKVYHKARIKIINSILIKSMQ